MKQKPVFLSLFLLLSLLASCSETTSNVSASTKTGNSSEEKDTDSTIASSSENTSSSEISVADEEEYTGLPRIDIGLSSSSITSKTTYKTTTIEISNTKYSLSSQSVNIRGRGNSTWTYFPKKSYRIKFDEKTSLFGSSYKAKSWTLLANYADKTLSRNAIAFQMSEQMKNIAFTPKHVFVDLYMNGTYQGVYLLSDQVQSGEGRVDIDEDYSTDGDQGYLIELDALKYIREDGLTKGEEYFSIDDYNYVIKTPDTDDTEFQENPTLYCSYIKSYMEDAFDAIDGDSYEEVEKYIDVNSFAETYIVQELMGNADVGYSSFYVYKDTGGKLYAGPVWDFDLSSGDVNHNYGNSKTCPADESLYASTANPFYSGLLEHSEFKKLVSEDLTLYSTALKAVIELTNPDNENGYYQTYKDSLEENFETWNILGTRTRYEPESVANIKTVSGQFSYLYDWLSTRWTYLNENY